MFGTLIELSYICVEVYLKHFKGFIIKKLIDEFAQLHK